MSIRSQAYSAMAYRGQVSPQLNDVLRRNGMSAALAVEGNQHKLLVQGHDSPMLTYNISEKQFAALAEGGTNYSNKKAFNVFNGIVDGDFDVPSSFVAARNVNSRVVMGLHGVRDGAETYMRPHAFGPGFLEWGARQPGFHIRRFGDVPMVVEHADGRLRPGELKAGDYGYYYKGQQKQETDPLKDMQTYFPPVQVRPRPAEPAIPYKEAITSDVYFTDEKWQEVLSSHGIIVDADKKTLTIQSTKAQQDFVYDLTDDEVKKLTQNTLKGNSVQNRLNIINRVIGGDFQEPITKAMLNSNERIAISLKPEVEQELMQKSQVMQQTVIADPLKDQHQAPSLNPNDGYVDGSRIEDYDERKGWFREGKHGREVEVGDIWVEKAQKAKEQTEQQEKDNAKKQDEGKEEKLTYRMCAVINGEVVAHEISKKQYDKFMAVDDYQRQRMMSKVFGEVDMKTRPEMRQSFNLGAFMAAGLTAVREATFVGADIAHNVEHIKHPHSGPELYQEVHGTGRIYVKPGVDSPQNIAERAFEAGLNAGIHEGMGRGR